MNVPHASVGFWALLLGAASGLIPAHASGQSHSAAGQSRINPPPARPASLAKGSAIIEPSQGRPVFAAPGDDLYFAMRLPKAFQGNIYISLVHHRIPDLRRDLRQRIPPKIIGTILTIVLKVPDKIPAGLYDLEVGNEAEKVREPCCVAIVERFKKRFRIVHLSDMNIGELTAPDFDDRLPAEINLLAPEFVLATGNYTQWARIKNQPDSWLKVKRFFRKFDAPVFMLCGATDHEISFSRLVSPNQISAFDYGDYHGLLLLDHAAHPVEQDGDQLQWIANQLTDRAGAAFNFIVSNSPTLGLIRHWKRLGDLDGFVRRHRLKMFVTGGHQDPVADALRQVVGNSGLHVIQTHQSSTARLGGASGITHYRIIEVNGNEVSYTYPAETDNGRLNSVPAGRLRVRYDRPNDGSVDSVTATVYNGLNQSLGDCRVTFCLSRPLPSGSRSEPSGPSVKVVGGKLESTIVTDRHIFAQVRVDMPDKSTRKVLATTKAWVPPRPAITIRYDGPDKLTFRRRAGLSAPQPSPAYVCDQPAHLVLANTGQRELPARPVVRLNGEQIDLKLPAGTPWPLIVPAGSSVKFPLDLKLYNLSPGSHQLQALLLDDPLARLSTHRVTLVEAEAR